jgi:hypothetical protein
MRLSSIAALAAAVSMAAAQPVAAAELHETQAQRMGAFAGARLRIPLGGDEGRRQVRAGLTVAPTLHSRSMDGASRLRIGQGVEFGLTGREPVHLSIGGTPVSQLGQVGTVPGGPRRNLSTGEWIGVGVGTVVVVLGVAYLLFSEWIDCDEDEECS